MSASVAESPEADNNITTGEPKVVTVVKEAGESQSRLERGASLKPSDN